MKILFIISASIAITKCNEILRQLSNQQIFIDCIVTNNAKKMTEFEDYISSKEPEGVSPDKLRYIGKKAAAKYAKKKGKKVKSLTAYCKELF